MFQGSLGVSAFILKKQNYLYGVGVPTRAHPDNSGSWVPGVPGYPGSGYPVPGYPGSGKSTRNSLQFLPVYPGARAPQELTVFKVGWVLPGYLECKPNLNDQKNVVDVK
eukprot:3311966-Rhodomonas_salina.1